MLTLVAPERVAQIEQAILDSAECSGILRFLVANETAMDTVHGIAACWVNRDPIAVRSALDRLIWCGVVESHTVGTGTLYGLTRESSLRGWLLQRYRKNGSRAEVEQAGAAAPNILMP